MHNVGFALEGAWKVLIAGLVLGAGLPVLFGLGIRSLAYGAGGDPELHETGGTGPKSPMKVSEPTPVNPPVLKSLSMRNVLLPTPS